MKEFIRTHKRAVLLGLAAALIVAASIGGTLAWLTSNTGGLVNTFTPGNVPNTVEERFENGVKSNVRVKNTGNVPAYIRVALVPIWRNLSDDSGAGISASLADFDFVGFPGTNWEDAGGYYYYTQPVDPAADGGADSGMTGYLFTACTVKQAAIDANPGKYLELQILAQSIQADGMGATGAKDAFAKALATTTNP